MALDPAIAEHLAADDDASLWDMATNTILNETSVLYGNAPEKLFAQIGCCRHWIRPHQRRWTADGGFAWPAGYDKTTTGYSFSALPELEWSVYLRWTGVAWEPGRTGERCLLLRVSIPGRTARHLQAAVHTIWTPRSPMSKEKVLQLYGFRKKDGVWLLTATQELRPRQ